MSKELDITREDEFTKALVWVLGHFETLYRKGYVACSGSPDKLTAVGRKQFRRLERSGWRPSDELLHAAVDAYRRYEEDPECAE